MPRQSLRQFMEIPRPKDAILPPDRMRRYSDTLRLLLESAGVSTTYGGSAETNTPEIGLSDGMTVVIHRGTETKRVDGGDEGCPEVRPWAVLRVTGPAQPEPAYPITWEPVIAYNDKIYVHTGSPDDIYRPANNKDDEALQGPFADLSSHLPEQPLE